MHVHVCDPHRARGQKTQRGLAADKTAQTLIVKRPEYAAACTFSITFLRHQAPNICNLQKPGMITRRCIRQLHRGRISAEFAVCRGIDQPAHFPGPLQPLYVLGEVKKKRETVRGSCSLGGSGTARRTRRNRREWGMGGRPTVTRDGGRALLVGAHVPSHGFTRCRRIMPRMRSALRRRALEQAHGKQTRLLRQLP